MTLVLRTQSGEELDSGFYGNFMKLSRIGKYTFETKDLCGLVKNLAENPNLKKAEVFGYSTNEFWKLEKPYESSVIQKCIDSIAENDATNFDNFIEKNRELSAGDKIKLMDDKIRIPVKICRLKKLIKIGEYEIENFQFVQLAYYLIHGGFCGWYKETPDFAKSALLAIQLSKNDLYNSLHNSF